MKLVLLASALLSHTAELLVGAASNLSLVGMPPLVGEATPTPLAGSDTRPKLKRRPLASTVTTRASRRGTRNTEGMRRQI